MRGPSCVNRSTNFQQARPLFVLLRIKYDVSPGAIVACPGKCRGNSLWAAEEFCPCRQVQRMDPLKVIPTGILGHGDDINGVSRAVDHRRSSNSNFGRNLTATAVVTGGFPAAECGGFPKRCGSCSANGIGVKGVNGTMFRDHIKNVFLLSADR